MKKNYDTKHYARWLRRPWGEIHYYSLPSYSRVFFRNFLPFRRRRNTTAEPRRFLLQSLTETRLCNNYGAVRGFRADPQSSFIFICFAVKRTMCTRTTLCTPNPYYLRTFKTFGMARRSCLCTCSVRAAIMRGATRRTDWNL